ncbi:M3 family metallopeptidase [Agromyces atrinae]|uniref:M3 family peptidase n=1 Tax=Agromyces atrinae TaxID=592376 RepID=A0A4Q2MBV9_9MICO|nr:M3 family metallopeptidase [Agromyces atrinae]NYD66215.1 peptidyl-dipeptidase Dcp [Agromyces atrinae]RXZ86550.1 M3 family peptidase [Agromyces atrinae]
MSEANPFFSPSTLPYQLPDFARITDADYAPAIERGIIEHRAEIQSIIDDPAEPTFENTFLPLEESGQLLTRVLEVFYNKSSSDSTEVTNALEERFAPILAAHSDSIRLDSRLYAKIDAIHAGLGESGLDAESRYLVERYHTEFTLAGAALDDDAKEVLRDYNQRLSSLTTRFEKNLLADTNELAVHVLDAAELEGLSSGELSAAAGAATERGLDGYLVSLVLFTGHPYLASLRRPETRDRLLAASRARGIHGGEHDNRELVLEIVRLRADRARLLGFESHAAFVTADETAKTPEAVADMLDRLAPAAARNARAEQDVLQAVVDRDPTARRLEAADWAYYTEIVRSEKYDVDTSALRPYFELERVLVDGVFHAATALYGIEFTERPDLVAYHPDARVFEVHDADGSPVGLFVGDFYTRDSKRGGAWMNSLVSQSDLLGTLPVVVNNLNIPRPAAGEATLLTYDETNTLFHEFGHALHGLFARVRYPKFSGTSVYRDFVEFPSQVNEMWMLWPEVLANYAVHHETGERMPQAIVDRLRASEQFNEGHQTSEYLAAALLDQAWHRLSPEEAAAVTDVAAFEANALAAAGLDNPVVPTRYSSTYFAHTFAGGYDAGYYSYIWSEVLDADTVEWFRANGGLTRENGDRFRRFVLGVGGSRDPLDAFRDFRGRDAVIEPLLERRGLA